MSLTLKWHPCLSRTMSARTLAHCIHTHTHEVNTGREREKSTDVRMPDWLIHIGIHTKRTLANVAIVETAIGNNSKTHTLCIHSFCVRCCLFLAHFPSPSFAWIDDTKQLRPQNTRIFFYCVSNFDFEFVTLFSLFFQFKYLNLHLVPLEKSQSLNGRLTNWMQNAHHIHVIHDEGLCLTSRHLNMQERDLTSDDSFNYRV